MYIVKKLNYSTTVGLEVWVSLDPGDVSAVAGNTTGI